MESGFSVLLCDTALAGGSPASIPPAASLLPSSARRGVPSRAVSALCLPMRLGNILGRPMFDAVWWQYKTQNSRASSLFDGRCRSSPSPRVPAWRSAPAPGQQRPAVTAAVA